MLMPNPPNDLSLMTVNPLFDEFGHGQLQRLPQHKNPGLEIVYLRKGRMVWKCEGQIETVPPASIYFTLPWQEHGSVHEYEPGHEWFFIVLRLEKSSERRNLSLLIPRELGLPKSFLRKLRSRLLHAPFHCMPASALVAQIFPALISELENPGDFHAPRVQHLTSLILLELAHALDRADLIPPHPQADMDRLSRLLTQIQAQPGECWTLAIMSKYIGLQRTQLGALFRHQTGDTPIRYLNRIRVRHARELLQSTKKSITDIALECGFSSSQYFASVFKQLTGVPAHSYRQNGPAKIALPRQKDSG